MENRGRPNRKSNSLDPQSTVELSRKVQSFVDRDLSSDYRTVNYGQGSEENKYIDNRTLKLIIKRGAEENMLASIFNSLKNNQFEGPKIHPDILKKAKEFYKNLNVFEFKEEDFYFLFAEQLYQDKKNKFHQGEEPVQYFKTVMNEDQQPYARCTLDFKQTKDQKKYDFKYIQGGDKQALINNTHDDRMFSEQLEQDALTQLNHVSHHYRRPSYQLQKEGIERVATILILIHRYQFSRFLFINKQIKLQEQDELESQEERWSRIKQKIKENKITDLIRNAKAMVNTNSVHITHTEVIEIDKQEEAIYQYLKRRGKILDKRVLDNTKIKIMNDSINSISNSQSPEKINKSILSKNSISTTTKKNDNVTNNNNSLLIEKHSQSQPSSPLMGKYQKSICTSINNTPNNKSIVSTYQKNSIFKDESFELKSKVSSIDSSPLMKRLSEFSVASVSSASRNSQYKTGKVNLKEQSADKNRSKFKISSNKSIKLDKNDIQFIQHFKNISNKPDEQYFFLITVTRSQIEEYLNLRYPGQITKRILTFMECPQEMNFRQYRKWIERFNQWSLNDILFFCFVIFDFNQDGLICQTDAFDILRNKQTQMLEKDFSQISRYVGIKIKFTKNIDNLIDVPLFPDLYKQRELTYMTYRKIAGNEDFGEKEKFLKKIKEHKDMGVNLTLFSIWDQYKERFLEEKDIEEEIKLQEDIEENEKKKVKNIMSLGKGEYVRYFKSDKKFKLNFNQFKSIFIREKPFFFYDLIACLTLYRQVDISYPYHFEQEFSQQIGKLLKIRSSREEQEKQQALDNQMTAEKLNKLQVQRILKSYKDHGGATGAKKALEKLEIVPNINIQ